MKQLNVNAVRTSHYPCDPYLYDLADRHGLWIDDEVDIETHHHDNCPNDCLAERPEWQKAFLDRFVGMVERDKNHPSIFMWDTGNEAGLGTAHYAMAEWAQGQRPDPAAVSTSRTARRRRPVRRRVGPALPVRPGGARGARRRPRPSRSSWASTPTRWATASATSRSSGTSSASTRRCRAASSGTGPSSRSASRCAPRRTRPATASSAWLTGKPEPCDGTTHGKALSLSGLDDFVEVYRDPRLDDASQRADPRRVGQAGQAVGRRLHHRRQGRPAVRAEDGEREHAGVLRLQRRRLPQRSRRRCPPTGTATGTGSPAVYDGTQRAAVHRRQAGGRARRGPA